LDSSLLTAKARVVHLETGATTWARLVLDTGSHRSFVVTRLADELKLPTSKRERIDLEGFACNKTTIDSSIVCFGVIEQNGNVRQIQANTTPVISNTTCKPSIFSNEDAQVVQSVTGLLADEFGDAYSSEGGPDLLVGADYFWDFVNGAGLKTDTDLKLIPSSLGLLVAGRLSQTETDIAAQDEKGGLVRKAMLVRGTSREIDQPRIVSAACEPECDVSGRNCSRAQQRQPLALEPIRSKIVSAAEPGSQLYQSFVYLIFSAINIMHGCSLPGWGGLPVLGNVKQPWAFGLAVCSWLWSRCLFLFPFEYTAQKRKNMSGRFSNVEKKSGRRHFSDRCRCHAERPLKSYTEDEQVAPQRQPPYPDDIPVREQDEDALPPLDDIARSDDYGLLTLDNLDRLQGFIDVVEVDDRFANPDEDDWDQSSSVVTWN
jgi:hypothetical protein